jgi:tetratricopeptide (TPR) repeat protein
MAPLFTKAATLAAASPLQAEIARIKAASPDPKARAEAALALVENQIRYVALAMDDGGYVPAAADVTWARRFGDCKGKTVLLLALLKGLGIEAQPTLVSSQEGDGLDQRLPSASAFDHVIVRATIAGKVYWLDGTRLGDLKLDDIRTPAFIWALPVQTASAALTRVMPGPLERPNSVRSIRIDASAGLDVPAPTHAETLFRGDAAYALNAGLANLTPAQREAGLRQYWTKTFSALTVTKASASYDPVAREERIIGDGVSKMAWDDGTTCCRFYETDGYSMGWKADFTRPAGPHADAPFSAAFPLYEQNQETIILPYKGAGFTIQGEQVDRKVGAWSFHRKMAIDKGVFTLDASTQSLAPEFTPSEADATTLKDMAKVAVYVVSPRTYQMTHRELDLYEGKGLTSFKDYLARGEMMVRRARYAKARADLQKAVALDAKSVEAKAMLAESETLTGDLPGAHALVKQALELAPDDLNAIRAGIFLANFEGDQTSQLGYYDRVLAKKPQDAAWLNDRAGLYFARGETDKALAATDTVLKIDPKNQTARRLRVAGLIQARRGELALTELDAAIAAEPKAAYLHQLRGGVLQVVKDDAAAQAEYDAALALDKTSDGYVRRANARLAKDYAGSLADFDQALKLKPDNRNALIQRARTEAQAGKIEQAVAHIDAVAAEDPDNVSVRETRAWVYAKAGKTDLAVADIDWIRGFIDPSSSNLNNLCYAQAMSNLSLTKALADCDRAVELAPTNAAFRDSRAFVLLRLDRVDEALAEYDRVLKLSPYQTDSLFGRAIARMRKGQVQDARADLAAARALTPHLEDRFAIYGVSLPQTVASSNSATK